MRSVYSESKKRFLPGLNHQERSELALGTMARPNGRIDRIVLSRLQVGNCSGLVASVTTVAYSQVIHVSDLRDTARMPGNAHKRQDDETATFGVQKKTPIQGPKFQCMRPRRTKPQPLALVTRQFRTLLGSLQNGREENPIHISRLISFTVGWWVRPSIYPHSLRRRSISVRLSASARPLLR